MGVISGATSIAPMTIAVLSMMSPRPAISEDSATIPKKAVLGLEPWDRASFTASRCCLETSMSNRMQHAIRSGLAGIPNLKNPKRKSSSSSSGSTFALPRRTRRA
jgi:hypothetical protein